eukprot:g16558.t1
MLTRAFKTMGTTTGPTLVRAMGTFPLTPRRTHPIKMTMSKKDGVRNVPLGEVQHLPAILHIPGIGTFQAMKTERGTEYRLYNLKPVKK